MLTMFTTAFFLDGVWAKLSRTQPDRGQLRTRPGPRTGLTRVRQHEHGAVRLARPLLVDRLVNGEWRPARPPGATLSFLLHCGRIGRRCRSGSIG